MEKWFAYILQCNDGSFYVGMTDDVERRFEEHTSGRGGWYTRNHRPSKIVYVEDFKTKEEALKREKQLKGWSHTKKEKILKI